MDNETYSFKAFEALRSIDDVPDVQGDYAKDECSWSKLVGVVPAWYQFSVFINDVVLNEFIFFEIELVW